MQSQRICIGLACGLWTTVVALAQQPAAVQPAGGGQPATSPAKVGSPAPDFTLLDESGKKHTLSDLKDKVVVLEWVNQQCPWSVKVIEATKALRKKYGPKGVVWLGVESSHFRKAEENIQYIKEKDLGIPILMDNDGKVGRMYGAATTPHLFVINKGTLVYAGALHNNQQNDKKEGEIRNYVDEALAAVLEGKPLPVAETKAWGCSVKYKEEAKPAAK